MPDPKAGISSPATGALDRATALEGGLAEPTGASPSGSLQPERAAAPWLAPARRPLSWLYVFLRPLQTCREVWACTETHVLPAPNIRRLSAEDGSHFPALPFFFRIHRPVMQERWGLAVARARNWPPAAIPAVPPAKSRDFSIVPIAALLLVSGLPPARAGPQRLRRRLTGLHAHPERRAITFSPTRRSSRRAFS